MYSNGELETTRDLMMPEVERSFGMLTSFFVTSWFWDCEFLLCLSFNSSSVL